METPTLWVRIHVVPRLARFCPTEGIGGPSVSDLQPLRTTHMKWEGTDTSAVVKELWEDIHLKRKKTRRKWTGRSIFVKVGETPSDAADAGLDVSGSPIPPGSAAALRASLTTMRTQLAEAQR